MKKKGKILVTGGAGYIGSHTVLELLHDGYTPVVVDNFSKSNDTLLKGIAKLTGDSVALHVGDCCDKGFMKRVFRKEKDIVGVMHFAAYKSVVESVSEPVMYYRNNINSLLSLLDAMRDSGVFNLVFSSSCTVYGEPDRVPVDEQAPFKQPASPYGATKQMCEQILADITKADPRMRIVSLRYFNPIGAHPSALLGELPIDKPNNLLPYITQTAAGLHPKLVLFGDDYDTPDGTCIRDFIHVVDLAWAHVKAVACCDELPASAYRVYNLGTGEGVSVLQLVSQFIRVTGIRLSYEMGPRRPGDVMQTYADVKKAKKELRWSAKYAISEALRHAWVWEKKIRHLE